MGRGGARHGAGRPPGSVSRRNAEVVTKALAAGITPIEYLLGVLRDEKAAADRRGWAAEKAAPYLHPRPAPLERTIEIQLPDTSSVEGIGAALDAIIETVAHGKLSPAEGQSLVALIEARRKAIETYDLVVRVAKLEGAFPPADK